MAKTSLVKSKNSKNKGAVESGLAIIEVIRTLSTTKVTKKDMKINKISIEDNNGGRIYL